MRKYVASSTLHDPKWKNTVVINRDDLIGEIKRLKAEPGKDIVQYGIGDVSYEMMKHSLIDEFRLWIHPIFLGKDGPKVPHFKGSPLTELRLLNARTLKSGVVIVAYACRSNG
jgi:dihydrofolate reductase